MDFVSSVKSCFSNYATFSGRASRSEFWWWVLFSIILAIVTSLIDMRLEMAASVATLLPGIAVTARRLHDIDRSGWWMLLAFTIIGIPVVIYWYCQKGSPEQNRFGVNPLPG